MSAGTQSGFASQNALRWISPVFTMVLPDSDLSSGAGGDNTLERAAKDALVSRLTARLAATATAAGTAPPADTGLLRALRRRVDLVVRASL